MTKRRRGQFGEIPCAMCGKEFIPEPCSIFKLTFAGQVNHFCSWTCYNEACKVKDKHVSSRYLRDRKEAENANHKEVSELHQGREGSSVEEESECKGTPGSAV